MPFPPGKQFLHVFLTRFTVDLTICNISAEVTSFTFLSPIWQIQRLLSFKQVMSMVIIQIGQVKHLKTMIDAPLKAINKMFMSRESVVLMLG